MAKKSSGKAKLDQDPSASSAAGSVGAPPGAGSQNLVPLPTRMQRIATPGMAFGLVAALVFVYFAWGMAFEPRGTGSNVVLGLLMALALIYLIAANIGPFLDQAIFTRGDPKVRELLRELVLAIEDFERLAISARKGKEKRVDGDGAQRLDEEAMRMRGVYSRFHEASGVKEQEKARHELTEALQGAQTVADSVFGKDRAGFLVQLRSLSFAFAIALALRAFVVEPFQIPSGSMIPTLQVGDHLFVARFWYGLSIPFMAKPKYLMRWDKPEPGDVIVFVAPDWVGQNSGDDWIKRVIAGPGQRVRLEDDVVIVDDIPYSQVTKVAREAYMDYSEAGRRWRQGHAKHVREHVPDGVGGTVAHSIYDDSVRADTWPLTGRGLNGLSCSPRECTVQEGFVFVMGDNRNNSNDGRKWGAVPIDNVKGKALFIWMSVDGSKRSVDLGRFTLPSFRWDRLFDAIE